MVLRVHVGAIANSDPKQCVLHQLTWSVGRVTIARSLCSRRLNTTVHESRGYIRLILSAGMVLRLELPQSELVFLLVEHSVAPDCTSQEAHSLGTALAQYAVRNMVL